MFSPIAMKTPPTIVAEWRAHRLKPVPVHARSRERATPHSRGRCSQSVIRGNPLARPANASVKYLLP